MSYDLYFKTEDDGKKPPMEAFAAWFKGRPHYTTTASQAIYENDDTGIYFVFDFENPEEPEFSDCVPVTFHLSYFRPHIFGLEAEPEVRAFVEKFGLAVSDPQINGMGEGEYSADGFFNGWNTGNKFSYRAFVAQNPKASYPTMAASKIELSWRWNRAKEALQKKLGDAIFVPRFMFLKFGDGVYTTIVWPDGISIAVPETDTVVIPRKSILPKKLFSRAREDLVMAEWNELNGVFQGFPVIEDTIPYTLLKYSVIPPAILQELRSFPQYLEKLEGIEIDKVLNTELVENARNAQSEN